MIIMLAKIIDKSKTVGYRLMDCSKLGSEKAVVDIKSETLKEKMKTGLKVLNAELTAKGEVHGSNGSLDRYTSIDINGKPLDKTPLVVLFRLKDGFMCANYSGASSQITSKEALDIANKNGIANGKITTRGDKKVISSINGEYPEMPSELKKKEKEIIIVSNEHSEEELFNRIIAAQKTKRIIGKLDASSTDRVIRYMIGKCGLLKAVENKDNDKIAEACISTLKFLELVSRVGDKKTIVKHATGLKAVKSDVYTENGDLFDIVVNASEDKAVNFKSN